MKMSILRCIKRSPEINVVFELQKEISEAESSKDIFNQHRCAIVLHTFADVL